MSRQPAGPRKVLRWLRKRLLPPPAPVRTPEALSRDDVARGDRARDLGDWLTAAEAYGAALAHQPGQTSILVQRGHMLKEAGALAEAEAAYRAAAQAAPLDSEPWLHLAHVLKAVGRHEAAIDAFVEALRRDPGAAGARDELISAGVRHRLPRPTFGSARAIADVALIGRNLDAALDTVRDWVQVSTYPLDAWDAFRRAYPVTPPPSKKGEAPVVVVVDAMDAIPAAVVRTLDSLVDQKHARWQALVRAGKAVSGHPVASLEAVDPRIVFVGPELQDLGDSLTGLMPVSVLALPAGAVLDPQALAWFLAASRRTGADLVYADHDYHEDHWRRGPLHREPALQSAPDIDDLATSPRPPVAVLFTDGQSAGLVDALSGGIEPSAVGRALIVAALNEGRTVAHLPRLLTSVWIGSAADSVPAHLERPSTVDPDDRILVIIPTRDQSGLLKACVESLYAFADRPDAVDIVIVDNRSAEEETRTCLAELSGLAGVRVLTMDEPFNWARLNNEAARHQNQPLLVFANNDVEAVARGWDTAIRRELARPKVGVVGARLLYADRTLQHGGIVLGASEGRPMHEGVGADPLEDGPMGRYRRTRPVAAVTGAFMAVRRETFETLGGFDERLIVGYNDIDLCLRARAAGLRTLYAADLILLHHESRTRGLNNSADKCAWDDTELKRLFDTWGEGLFVDPGVNPHWGSADGRPLDGYRDPTATQILTWLDQSVSPAPWSLARPPG